MNRVMFSSPALVVLAAAVLVSCGAEARADSTLPEFGETRIDGEGCADRLSARPSTGLPLVITFSGEELSVGKDSGLARAQLRCRVVLPVRVQEGFQVRFASGSWKGNVHLPAGSGSSATVNARTFFGGAPDSGTGSINLAAARGGPDAPDFPVDSEWNAPVNAPDSWSPCGGEAKFTLQLTLVLRGDAAAAENASLKAASLELPSPLYKRCATPPAEETRETKKHAK